MANENELIPEMCRRKICKTWVYGPEGKLEWRSGPDFWLGYLGGWHYLSADWKQEEHFRGGGDGRNHIK